MVLLTSGFFTLAAIAANTTKPANTESDYRIRVFDNCKVVAEYPMTQAQIEAYLDLQKMETSMRELELPIKAIETQMQDYSTKIESLTALAIQETETILHIDKTYLKQQKDVADQMSELVKLHQSDFDALNEQGKKITAVANKFEVAMATTLDGIEHDQIEVLGPDEPNSSHYCSQGM